MLLRRTAILLLLLAAPVWAAFCSPDSARPGPRHNFEFFAGYSPGSATLIGAAQNERFFTAGFGYSYRCWAWSRVAISYSAQLMPAAVLFEPGHHLPRFAPAHAVYGFGITPLGFTADFGRGRRASTFLETDEGIIASAEPIPIDVPGATGLNFLVDFGGGLRIRIGERRAIAFGYKFLHISNASTSPVNPGVDNNVFYVAYSILR